ncbi:DUF6056 family protein [Citrobacter amalonaticus]|uniref:DUF6056 family protein n=1 Tax=Citrobacter amalonaticus TaxID=35703 RepID=UPI0019057FAD|nr:DUF6056 family protein [Citrobacter amalonaticus]MBJ9866124.1 hypothetical protein [Citrobacter amalonaticus]
MRLFTDRVIGYFLYLAFFGIVFSLYLKTPMQSDDYSYLLKGLSIESSVHHYMTWSGRLVADTLSSAILITENKVLIALFNSFLLFCMLWSIAAIPFGKRRDKSFYLCFSLISVAYWVGNPILGQTTLWTVGAANYVYPNALLCLALYYFFLNEMHKEKVNSYALCALAFFSGIGNENMSVSICFLSFVYIIYLLYAERRVQLKTLAPCLSYLFGSIVLIVSPGNFARKEFFKDWYELPFSTKIVEHITVRMPDAIQSLWLISSLTLVSFFIVMVDGKRVRLPLLFIVAAFISILVMVASPYLALRSLNCTLILMLLSISILSSNKISITSRKLSVWALLLAIITPYSAVKIYNEFTSYASLSEQQVIRDRIMRSGISYIPMFYTGMFFDKGDAPSDYFSPDYTGKYYGIPDVSQYSVPFDYSFITSGKWEYTSNTKHEALKAIFHVSNRLIFEIDKNKFHGLNDGESFFLHLINEKGTEFNRDFYSKVYCIESRCFVASDPVIMGGVTKIEFGVYNRYTNKSTVFYVK